MQAALARAGYVRRWASQSAAWPPRLGFHFVLLPPSKQPHLRRGAGILAAAHDLDGEAATLPAGCQVCIADVTDCRPLTAEDLEAAYLPDDFDPAGQFAWTLANVREVEPAPHKGRLRLYDTPDATISPL